MGQKTALYDQHVKAGAKIVDFAGWDMPLHYGSQIDEHHHVRKYAGMFDVSHMGVVDIHGKHVKAYLRYLLCNDVEKLTIPGKALYTCMLNEQGGVLDDLIVYYLSDTHYRVVINAAMRDRDWAWMNQQSKNFEVELIQRNDLAMIAIQGPQARAKVQQRFPEDMQETLNHLTPFQAALYGDWLIARTGYTGEDGYEVILPADSAQQFWQDLLQITVYPCGLGARDTLRLEAGLNLYGTDMDESVTPLEANLAWTVAWDPKQRDFIGRDALERQKAVGIKQRLVGVMLEERGVLRNHQKIKVNHDKAGEITSGSYSPTLEKAIGFARIPIVDEAITEYFVDMRGKWMPLKIVKLPFVKQGKILI